MSLDLTGKFGLVSRVFLILEHASCYQELFGPLSNAEYWLESLISRRIDLQCYQWSLFSFKNQQPCGGSQIALSSVEEVYPSLECNGTVSHWSATPTQ